jgi:cell wall-associated NlpC family hydrolase
LPAVRPLAFARGRRVRLAAFSAATATGVLATTLTLSVPAASAQLPSHLALTPSSRTITPGAYAHVDAVFTSNGSRVAGKPVKLYYRYGTGDSFHYWTTVTTNSNGVAGANAHPSRSIQLAVSFDGDTGYAAAKGSNMAWVYVANTGQRLVQEAARHRGAPYVWGATGPDRFDCSGFTLYVVRRVTGRTMARTAQDQYYSSTRHLTSGQARPGDLIFYRNGGSITHVAVYAGNGYQWAETSSGGYVKYQRVYSTNVVFGRPY